MRKLQRVMCVEDDPDIRMILGFTLEALGHYDICLCKDGYSALAQCVAFLPDLVLLDVMMPDLSGPQTLAALRELSCMQSVPVVFLTAKAMPDELETLLEHGAIGVIVKPFDPLVLPESIELYWQYGCRDAG